jgi:hypothetical protein
MGTPLPDEDRNRDQLLQLLPERGGILESNHRAPASVDQGRLLGQFVVFADLRHTLPIGGIAIRLINAVSNPWPPADELFEFMCSSLRTGLLTLHIEF